MAKVMRRFNWLMFGSMLALIAIGTIAIWSAGNARAEVMFHGMWVNNLVTAILGLAIYFALALVDYRKILDLVAVPAYVVAVALLVIVLVFGSTVYGGRRWLWFFQPSELAKLCVIAVVASLFGGCGTKLAKMKDSFRGFLLAGVIVGVPVLLILAEPDLGTAITLLPAAALMLFVAKVWRRGLIAIAAVLGLVALVTLLAVYEAEKPGVAPERREAIMRYLPLRDHQVKRVKVFLFPEADQMGAGYNLRQAKIAIGSGGFSGKGIGKGETNHLKYLPQAISMNDFIFCVWAEETGFVGSVSLLLLFAALVIPGCWVAFVAADDRGRLLAIGVSALVFAHVYINIAMSIGLVPITGLPLPFISSGRTFLIVVIAGLGFVQSVSIHREEITR